MQDSILPGDYVVSESSGIQNCEDDNQFGSEHEVDEECDTKLEMTECKEKDDEVSSCHEFVAKSSLVDHSSFDDTIDDSIDTNSLDVEPLNPDNITYPDPLNWTFSKEDVPNTSFISFDTIGMETEFLGSDPDSIQCEALQHLRFSLQGSELLAKWFVLPSNKHCIQLCTVKTNRTGSPVISFTIEILVNFEWLLRIPQGILDWKNHPMLMQLPLHIKTVSDAMKIINEIDNAKHCDGINDPKFHQLVIKHKGRFFDRCGKL